LNIQIQTRKLAITAAILCFLMLSSTFLIISTMPSATAQTVTPAADTSSLLQYTYPYFDGDAAYSRFATGPGPNTANILFRAKGYGSSMSIAVNGYVLVRASGRVVALDPFDAHVVWRSENIGAGGSLVYIDSTHLMTGNGSLKAVCINPQNGQTVWSGKPINIGATASADSVYSPTEKMYYSLSTSITWGNYTNDLPILTLVGYDFSDPNNPKVAWKSPIETLAVDSSCWYGDGKVYASENAGFIVAYNARTGAVVWRTPNKGQPGFAGSYYMGRVLHGGQDGNFYCMNSTTGEVMWIFNPGTFWSFWSAGTACAYGKVYELNTDGGLYCLDVLTGKLVWKYQGPGHFYPGFPVIADGKIYAATGTGQTRNQDTGVFQSDEVACLNATTGEVIWTLPITIAIHDGPIVAYGNVYFTAADGVPGIVYTVAMNELWCISDINNDWNNFRKDAAQTSSSAGPTNISLKWKYQTGGQVYSSPAIVNGMVYFGSNDKYIYALNAQTGAKIWSFKTNYPQRSSPAVYDGKLYTGADDGNIYCLNALTGTQLWMVPAGGITYFGHGMDLEAMRSSPMVYNGRVYVGSLDKNLYCLDANSGAVIYKFAAGGEVTSTAAIIAGDGIYFTANTPPISSRDTPLNWTTTNFTLYKLGFDGTIAWTFGLPRTSITLSNQIHYDCPMSPTVVNGKVYIHDDVSSIYCLNATTSAVIFKAPLTAGGTGREYLSISSILYANDRIWSPDYFAISCFNATTGAKLYTQWLGRELLVSCTYAYGKVYVGNEEGTFRVIAEDTGKTLSYYHPGTNMWGSPCLSNGYLYWGCGDFYMYCFKEADLGKTTYYPTGTSAYTTYFPAQTVTPAALIATPSASVVAPAALQAEPVQSAAVESVQTQPSTFALSTEAVIALAAIIAIALVAVVALVFRKRK
jgi:eukaryotic-like serine/threonine-protein kinase